MPEVKIRPTVATDLPILMALDHSCNSDYVWQMDLRREEEQVLALFREIRLPRSVSVPYPRPAPALADEWNRRDGMLTAITGDQMVGYLRLTDRVIPKTAWVTDLVVASRFRRQGIAAGLLLAGQSWALDRHNERVMVEMSSKSHPGICLVQKLGYEFCGYNDHYYKNQDVALFFSRGLR